ncbi:MAG: Fe-Mn family superoxide dismutase [Candidatus Paceibacterota bacterium]|jgi:Fe-Mn family superoxide dismutase
MAYEAKNFDSLLGLEGFSDAALKLHFSLYQGYVANTNKLSDALTAMRTDGKGGEVEYAELERRFGWEFDGMRLHEYYFDGMSKTPTAIDQAPQLRVALEKEFGTIDAWEKDFRSIATMRGIGWGMLYYDAIADRFLNVWINEHHTGHLAGCVPLLLIDVFEHAFLIDYGTKRAEYISAYMKAVDWQKIEQRLKEARKEAQ